MANDLNQSLYVEDEAIENLKLLAQNSAYEDRVFF